MEPGWGLLLCWQILVKLFKILPPSKEPKPTKASVIIFVLISWYVSQFYYSYPQTTEIVIIDQKKNTHLPLLIIVKLTVVFSVVFFIIRFPRFTSNINFFLTLSFITAELMISRKQTKQVISEFQLLLKKINSSAQVASFHLLI